MLIFNSSKANQNGGKQEIISRKWNKTKGAVLSSFSVYQRNLTVSERFKRRFKKVQKFIIRLTWIHIWSIKIDCAYPNEKDKFLDVIASEKWHPNHILTSMRSSWYILSKEGPIWKQFWKSVQNSYIDILFFPNSFRISNN